MRIETRAREFTSAAELRAGYEAARARLWGPPPVQPKAEAVIAEPPQNKAPPPLFDLQASILFTEDMWNQEGARRLKARNVHRTVAEHYGITLSMIRCKSRQMKFLVPRQIAAYICTRHAGMTLPQVGRFTNRDHTTVLHARDKIERRIACDPAFAAEIAALISECGLSE